MQEIEEIGSVYPTEQPPSDPIQSDRKPQPAPRRLAPVRMPPRQGWADESPVTSPPVVPPKTVVEPENLPTVPSVSVPLEGHASSFEGLLSPPAESSSGGDVRNETAQQDLYLSQIDIVLLQRTPVGDMEVVGRPRSPSASSQSSKSSKRTSISAETSVQIRQRIRQQARSMLEKKRGSVQLQKRLLRSQTAQSSVDLKDHEDYEDLDKQIEQTVEVSQHHTIDSVLASLPAGSQVRVEGAQPDPC